MKKYKVCFNCKEKKKISHFTVNKSKSDGLDNYCRACKAEKKRNYKHAPGKKTYRSAKSGLHPLVPLNTYIVEACEVCGNDYYPRGPTYRKCEDCSYIANQVVYKSLVRYKVTNKTVAEVTKKYIHASACEYCARPFTESNPIWFDHIIPRCQGGSNEADNIALSCKQCNLCKAALSKTEWIELCRLVVENNKEY